MTPMRAIGAARGNAQRHGHVIAELSRVFAPPRSVAGKLDAPDLPVFRKLSLGAAV